jgi:cyclopropane fatty-acyl-phospholipid synthase-like methyltransferase
MISSLLPHLRRHPSLRVLPFLLLLLPACASAPPEESVRPGVNDNFLDPELDAATWTQRFEGESREVYANRDKIAAIMNIEPGMGVADIGAGTGMMLSPLATSTGASGKVYAVDISPGMIDHLRLRAADEGMDQVEVVHCSERSSELPRNSVDRVVCIDTYHHFEYPISTMSSIHKALRKGGEVLIVDFERIPGKSREWILGHVRAGKEEVLIELEKAGFKLLEDVPMSELEENYVLRLGKK